MASGSVQSILDGMKGDRMIRTLEVEETTASHPNHIKDKIQKSSLSNKGQLKTYCGMEKNKALAILIVNTH